MKGSKHMMKLKVSSISNSWISKKKILYVFYRKKKIISQAHSYDIFQNRNLVIQFSPFCWFSNPQKHMRNTLKQKMIPNLFQDESCKFLAFRLTPTSPSFDYMSNFDKMVTLLINDIEQSYIYIMVIMHFLWNS